MRIGIFGGSFNPPHNMHKNIALNLIKNGYVDKVIYVPTGNKYNKQDLQKDYQRYNMIKLMVEDYKNLLVSDYEFDKLTYTYETLDYFKSIYQNDDIYFICGSDNLNNFKTWKRYEYILNNYKILVIKRNNDNLDEIINYLNSENIVAANIPIDAISSTIIRNCLKENKLEQIKNDIDIKVLKYIKDNKLYF